MNKRNSQNHQLFISILFTEAENRADERREIGLNSSNIGLLPKK